MNALVRELRNGFGRGQQVRFVLRRVRVEHLHDGLHLLAPAIGRVRRPAKRLDHRHGRLIAHARVREQRNQVGNEFAALIPSQRTSG